MHVIAHHWPQSTLTTAAAADAHRVNVNSADGLVRAAEAAGARRFKYNLHIQRSRIT